MRYLIYMLLLISLCWLLIELSDVCEVVHTEETKTLGLTYDVTRVEWHWERLGEYIIDTKDSFLRYITTQHRRVITKTKQRRY